MIEGLNDIVVPEAISLVPQTTGWLLLLVIALLTAFGAAMVVWRRRNRNAYRREALALIPNVPLAELPRLVKRVALAAAPRTDVASLAGKPWLEFLDRTYGGTGFTEGPGRHLADLSFDPRAADRLGSGEELRGLVSTWVRRHRV